MTPAPGTCIPGALVPGTADPGFPDAAQYGGFVTLDDAQVISGAKTFTAAGQAAVGGHWYGAVTTGDITILPNSAISTSASMFLDNNAGQVYEFYSDSGGNFGVFDKSGGGQVMLVADAAHGHGVVFYGGLQSQNNTLDNGSGVLTTTNDVHVGEWLYVTGNVLTTGGGYSAAVTTKTVSYSIGSTDSTVLLNGTSLTATLPTAAGITGRIYTVKQVSASTGTVATTSSQTIDGATTKTLAQYKFVTVQSDGSNWLIIASN